MRYEIINTSIGADTPEYDIQFEERNDKDEVIVPYAEFPTDRYFVGITLKIRDTESTSTSYPKGHEFTEAFVVVSNNSQTRTKVNEEREKAIEDFINKLNSK